MGVMTLFLHETHRVRGALEDRFEAHYRDGWMAALAVNDDARLVWYTHCCGCWRPRLPPR